MLIKTNSLHLIAIVVAIAIVLAITVNAQSPQAAPPIDLQKKIAGASPSPLPQNPRPDEPKAKRENPNLRGKIKHVETSGRNSASSEIHTYAMQDFDRFGELIRSVVFYEDYPAKVTVYGIIDGYRVSRSKIVEYAPGERKTEPKNKFALDSPRNVNLPKDPRFDERSVTEYDDRGRPTKWTSYRSNGEEIIRVTFAYNGDLIEERTVWEGGVPEYTIGDPEAYKVNVVGKKGLIIESRSYKSKDSLPVIRRSVYRFDAKSNWIECSTYLVEAVDGKESLKFERTLFRTITYY